MPLSLTKDVYIFDLEADALLGEVTKIHCLSVGRVMENGELDITSTKDYDEMREFFLRKDITKVGHNILRYDAMVGEKILGIKIPTNCFIDTLPLSWYLYPKNHSHGLEYWGEMIGNSKIKISDWKNLAADDYIKRCETDVQINYELYAMQRDYLLSLYRTEEAAITFVKYSNFKSLCVRDQEIVGIRFDTDKAQHFLNTLEVEKAEKITALAKVIPPEDVNGTKTIPKEMYKKDGSMSKKWQDWLEFKRQYGVPDDWIESITYVKGSKEGNPNSPVQIKNWLFALGWEPCTLQYNRDKITGAVKTVPQVYNKETGEITPSVRRLVEQEPGIEILDGLGKLKHRIGVFKGLIESCVEQEDGTHRVYASMGGYANTLRLQHRTVVNLPKVGTYQGEEIRSCFIADEGDILCGADLSNIEAKTRDHYITSRDPDYVATMQRSDFDSHIDIAVLANMMSKEDGEWYVPISKKIDDGYDLTEEESIKFKPLKKIRGAAKIANFSCTYGVGKATLARNVGMKESAAKKLIDTYWKRNWAVREFAESDLRVKDVNGQNWIQNPVSKFWLSLRSDKDRFSTVNQSTAVFCLDIWLAFVRKSGITVQYQCHDEILFSLPKGDESSVRDILKTTMDLTNQQLKLNVTIGMAPSFGNSYSECH